MTGARVTQIAQVVGIVLVVAAVTLNTVVTYRYSERLKVLRQVMDAQAEELAEALKFILAVAEKMGYKRRDVDAEARRKAGLN